MALESKAEWKGTQYALNYAKHLEKLGLMPPQEPEMYQGRPIITRDSPHINGGVYFMNGFEALVVDDSKDEKIKAVYDEVFAEVQKLKLTGFQYEKRVLKIVKKIVTRVMPYDHGDTRAEKYHQIYGDNRKLLLGLFIGAGVCRHQALLAGYVIEKLIKQNVLPGKVSVDRNWLKDDPEGHAWTRYTTQQDEVYIVDVAQNYLGKLSMWIRTQWPYARPDELEKYKFVLTRIQEFIKKRSEKQKTNPKEEPSDHVRYFKISSEIRDLMTNSQSSSQT